MSKNAITGRVSMWINRYSDIGPKELSNPPENITSRLSYSCFDMSTHGYTKVGHADMVLNFDDPQTVVASQVTALQAQIKHEQAESAEKVTRMKRQINELLALPMAEEGC